MKKSAKAKHSQLMPKAPKVGKDAPAPTMQKQRFRDKNTSKMGMGGPSPKGAKKRLAGVMI